MDQQPDVPEKMRHEHSGDEGLPRPLPARRAHHPAAQDPAAQKQEALRAGIRELQDSVAYIDWKQNFYDEVLSGKRPYESNLIRVEK
ncbi:hypothetical protein [Oscillibacter sp. ER4]|uniref:hypothetical protein n=1 Tax=Oscillibacter sp. ER4 TaxID=1519439 RepID=UPI000AC60974